jgi:hypothetical protein
MLMPAGCVLAIKSTWCFRCSSVPLPHMVLPLVYGKMSTAPNPLMVASIGSHLLGVLYQLLKALSQVSSHAPEQGSNYRQMKIRRREEGRDAEQGREGEGPYPGKMSVHSAHWSAAARAMWRSPIRECPIAAASDMCILSVASYVVSCATSCAASCGQDMDLVPLLIQENYLNHRPQRSGNEMQQMQVSAPALEHAVCPSNHSHTHSSGSISRG